MEWEVIKNRQLFNAIPKCVKSDSQDTCQFGSCLFCALWSPKKIALRFADILTVKVKEQKDLLIKMNIGK